MGIITGAFKNSFSSAEEIYAKVRRDLKSYASANLIDDGDFPVYTGEVLDKLGISSMMECETIIDLTERTAPTPSNFVELYAAYKCTPNFQSERWVSQGENIIRQDVTCEVLGVKDNCAIDCCYDGKVLSKVTTQMYINNSYNQLDYHINCLLTLSPNVKSICSEKCLNKMRTSSHEITINNKQILANFDGCIYMKYYGYPLDDNGLPMVLDNIYVKKAIEYYIKYQLLLSWWYNSEVSDIQNKWQKAEQEFNLAFAEAEYQLKLPAFSTLVNATRNQRNQNLVTFFSRQFR